MWRYVLLSFFFWPIVLSGLLRLTDSDYSFGIFCPLCCLVFFDLQILITPLVSFAHCVVWSSSTYIFWLLLWYLLTIALSGLLRLTDSDYSFGIICPLCCLVFFGLHILITPLVSFDHCVVWSSSTYRFWLPLCYLLAHCVVWSSSIYGFRLLLRYLQKNTTKGVVRICKSKKTRRRNGQKIPNE
jgi:hypothetical protein